MTIKMWALSCMTVLLGWFALQLAVMRFSDAAPGAIILFPAEEFVSNLPADVAIVGSGSNWLAVKSDTTYLGQALYSAGARIVLPAGLSGCLAL